ncbi:hypothetical protein DNTS_005930 [Danionella cerebrum]|uniref:[histone H3]-trimethyl-L-lysine(9) demethylase n=1 Tax=Danionella cerebrum TaxID=2873325 RepID=A0A553NIV3_9TELE|nr:hypothetical protein DNTS_005930 [Danionella translucida]
MLLMRTNLVPRAAAVAAEIRTAFNVFVKKLYAGRKQPVRGGERASARFDPVFSSNANLSRSPRLGPDRTPCAAGSHSPPAGGAVASWTQRRERESQVTKEHVNRVKAECCHEVEQLGFKGTRLRAHDHDSGAEVFLIDTRHGELAVPGAACSRFMVPETNFEHNTSGERERERAGSRMAGVWASALANPACKIMTFRPTMEEFRDFNQYLVFMESQGAHRAGLAKVIPPKGWRPRRSYDDIDDFVIPAPIQQMVAGQSGLFTQYNIQKKPLTVQEFRRLANSDMYCTPRYLNYEDLERKYWKNLTFVSPIYGADDIEEWNIGHLNSILDVIEEDCGVSIQGVNTPYLYFGMWKTSFSWHTEDMDLYSINYLHFGEPKSWYAIPPEQGKRLERLATASLETRPELDQEHWESQIEHRFDRDQRRTELCELNQRILLLITQEAGEFMITFPYGYHAGFNHGFNCAESTNFASIRWIDYGKLATQDMVKISMDPFVRHFQPERYEAWTQGKDSNSLDHTLPTPSTTPELQSWLQRRRRKAPSTSSVRNPRACSKRLKTVVSAPVKGCSRRSRGERGQSSTNKEEDAKNQKQLLYSSELRGMAGPCRQMCVVKVTRVESDLLPRATVRDASPERPLLTASSHNLPDECEPSPETPSVLDEGQISTNSTRRAELESTSGNNITVDAERTPRPPLNSESGARALSASRSQTPGAPAATALFSASHCVPAEATGTGVLTEKSVACGTSAPTKRQSSVEASDNYETQTSAFHEMPLLMPELAEEGAHPQSLAPEMPSLTLAVRPHSADLHHPCPDRAPVLHLEKPRSVTGEEEHLSEGACPHLPSTELQNSISSSPCLVGQWKPPEDNAYPSTDRDSHRDCEIETRGRKADETREDSLVSVEDRGEEISQEQSGSLTHSRGMFTESKPFTIWNNLTSENPAVLIESLQPELEVGLITGGGCFTDYAHDSIPYSMWSESGCRREKISESPSSSPGTQTWTNLEPIGMQSSDTEVSQSVPFDLKQGHAELEAAECHELGASTVPPEPEEDYHKIQEDYESAKSERDGSVSDSDSCESGDKDAESSSSSGSSDERAMSEPDFMEMGLEPGEVCSYQTVKKTTKSWRHPLRKPTARAVPSAVKQQAASDDEPLEDCVNIEEEPEAEDWAKPLVHLWQHRKPSFQCEQEYNSSAARSAPHCAVCTLFLPYHQPENFDERRDDILMGASPESQVSSLQSPRARSRPLIPEICFAYEEGPCPLNTLLEEDGSSAHVTCSSCCVQVHASCYGVAALDVGPVWSCDRCVSGDLEADCCLCNLRGGALKRTTDDRWAHVMCAVGLPEVKFINVVKRALIDVSAVPVQRYKLKCIYCRNRISRMSGACIQCSCGRCPTSFHVTCAHAAGVPMEPDDWPYVVFITCHRHQSRSSSAKAKTRRSELEVGQTVISKHKNLRYYSSRVSQVTAQTFYEVMFDDGSFSNDTFPEDIVSRDCAQLGAPEVGETVQVEFEDGSQVLAKREDIYTLDEDLPKKVKGRLSTASSMRFQDAFFTTQAERKRRRTPNSRFQTDYIAHICPRTFARVSETRSKANC